MTFITTLLEVFALGQFYELICRECGRKYPAEKLYFCEECFAPLEVIYDYDTINLERRSFKARPKDLWRYIELLPVADKSNIVSLGAGYTSLRKADRLGRTLGLNKLYVKDDTVNPTNSFKDRPVTVAISKALEFNAEAVGCASTGNLAAASAAHAAKAGLPCYVFIPADIERNKIVQIAAYGANILAVRGTYDEANRLAMQIAEEYNWVFANFNVRPYYVEGSKTLAFEVCEQLNWNPPDHVIVPTASGAMLCAIGKGFDEFKKLGLIEDAKIKVSSAQASGCSPIVTAFKNGAKTVTPIEYPNTVAKSLAIGDPGDGDYALKRVRDSGGIAESVTDEEIVEGISLLAKTEGIFTEPAGGVTVAVLKKLVENGHDLRDETVVCYVTGNGLKTTEAILNLIPQPIEIEPMIDSFRAITKPMEAVIWSK
jgi:threonine synthase